MNREQASNVQRPTVWIERWALNVERWALKTLRIQSSVTAVRLSASSSAVVLFEFLDRLDDVVEIRPVAGFEFRMEQFAIGANLESAAARWD